jgi:hypothetical protein
MAAFITEGGRFVYATPRDRSPEMIFCGKSVCFVEMGGGIGYVSGLKRRETAFGQKGLNC